MSTHSVTQLLLGCTAAAGLHVQSLHPAVAQIDYISFCTHRKYLAIAKTSGKELMCQVFCISRMYHRLSHQAKCCDVQGTLIHCNVNLKDMQRLEQVVAKAVINWNLAQKLNV